MNLVLDWDWMKLGFFLFIAAIILSLLLWVCTGNSCSFRLSMIISRNFPQWHEKPYALQCCSSCPCTCCKLLHPEQRLLQLWWSCHCYITVGSNSSSQMGFRRDLFGWKIVGFYITWPSSDIWLWSQESTWSDEQVMLHMLYGPFVGKSICIKAAPAYY